MAELTDAIWRTRQDESGDTIVETSPDGDTFVLVGQIPAQLNGHDILLVNNYAAMALGQVGGSACAAFAGDCYVGIFEQSGRSIWGFKGTPVFPVAKGEP